jgi:predicted TPR repeat methyltransferase
MFDVGTMSASAASVSPAERLREIIAQHRAGDHAAAEAGYREHLREFPQDPSALHFLGLLRSHQGKNEEAVKFMVAALEADPEYVDAWSNLGVAYFRLRDYERAEYCARKAIEIAPEFANAWANLGMTLRARNDSEQALIAWGRALDLQPGMRNIAISYGHLLYRLDRRSEALEFYRKWQASMPDDPIPAHMVAALGGASTPQRASNGFVRETFDDFAESFDHNLQELHYRAPQLLADAVERFVPRVPGQKFITLDIGCGTGLCGPLLRLMSRRLVGVDLSPNMLSKAALRAVYEQLNCGELTEWLAACYERFDLAVAADVFCYFGDLSAAFANVRKVLVPGAHFVFSLESLLKDTAPRQAGTAAAEADLEKDYLLRSHGRYQHDRKYVRSALAAAGLEVVSIETDTLRYERMEAVEGLVTVARLSQRPTSG